MNGWRHETTVIHLINHVQTSVTMKHGNPSETDNMKTFCERSKHFVETRFSESDDSAIRYSLVIRCGPATARRFRPRCTSWLACLWLVFLVDDLVFGVWLVVFERWCPFAPPGLLLLRGLHQPASRPARGPLEGAAPLRPCLDGYPAAVPVRGAARQVPAGQGTQGARRGGLSEVNQLPFTV